MEQILEIRDGCSTPEQLLKSRAFSRYLNIYKKEFVEELAAREGRQRPEAQHRAAMFKDLSAREVLAILEGPVPATEEGMERARAVVRFVDGAFHHYRSAPHRFWLQAGSFAGESDADNLKARLALAGWEAQVQKGEIPDKGARYRVRLGPYDNTDELNRVKGELARRGFDDAVIRY